MPEGDTIHYAANRIRPILEGHVPDALETLHPRFSRDRWPERLQGQQVRSVDAHGKHLFIRFANDLTIHSHLRMTGSWRVLDADRRPSRAAWLSIRRGGKAVVQFKGPVLELMTDSRTRIDQRIAGLGPDILAPQFDYGRFLRRLREDDPTRPIGDAVLDQRTVAGIGNLWRAEALLGGADRPLAPHRRHDRRGGHRDRRRRPPAHAGVGPPREGHARPAGLQQGRPPLPPLRHAHRGARPVGGQPHDLLVPRMSALRRVGHKGADLIAPGNTRESFDAALRGRRRHDRVRRPPRHVARRPRHAADPRPRSRARHRRRPQPRRGPRASEVRRVRRRRARRRPQAPRLRGASGRGAPRPRPGRPHARLVASTCAAW